MLLLAFQLLDCLTTYVGISLGGREAHPFLARLIAMNRWDLFVGGKVIMVLLVYATLAFFHADKRTRKLSLRTACATTAAVCVWNALNIVLILR